MRPVVSGGEFGLELIRQVILEGLQLLIMDTDRLGQIFARRDTTSPRLRDQAEAATEELVVLVTSMVRTGVNVYSHWPDQEYKFPLVRMAFTGEASEQERAMGDAWDTVPVLVGSRMYLDRTKGGEQRQAVRIQVMATSYDAAWALHTSVAHVLEKDKWRLCAAGAVNVQLTRQQPEIIEEQMGDSVAFRLKEGALTLELTWIQAVTIRTGPVYNTVTLEWTGEPAA